MENITQGPRVFQPHNDMTEKGKQAKSGFNATRTDNVKNPLIWPHMKIRYGYPADYSRLDLSLLMAGELEIMNSGEISDLERWGRTELLIATAYHSKNHEWQRVLNFHSNILLEVELGCRGWASRETFLALEANTLYNAPAQGQNTLVKTQKTFDAKPSVQNLADKPSDQIRNPTRKIYCRFYQNGKCRFSHSPHQTSPGNKGIQVFHFCATCHKNTGQFLEHPAISEECPAKK